MLVALHDLDVVRKHQRLVDFRLVPWAVGATPAEFSAGFEMAPIWPGLKDGAVIGWTNIDAPDCNPHMPMYVQFDEAVIGTSKHLIGALGDFTSLAYRIIKLFN